MNFDPFLIFVFPLENYTKKYMFHQRRNFFIRLHFF